MVPVARIIYLCLVLAAMPGTWVMAQEPAEPPSDDNTDRTVRRLGDDAGDEYQLTLSIPKGAPAANGANEQYGLPDPEQDAQLQKLVANLAARPGNRAAMAELDVLLDTVLVEAESHMDEERLDEAAPLLAVVRNVNPRLDGLRDAEQRLADMQQIRDWLSFAEAALANDMLIEPEARNAQHFYNQILSLDPDNKPAQLGLRKVQQGLVGYALEDARSLDFEGAEAWLADAALVRPQQDLIIEAREEIVVFRTRQALAIEQDVVRAIQNKEFDYAEFTLIDLIALGGHEDRVAELRERLNRERVYGEFVPGQVIQDQLARAGGTAPPVVVVPPGSFLMGSNAQDRSREDNEEPQHRVALERSFGIGVQEVTVGQFRQFVEATGYQTDAEAGGSSRVWDESLGRLTERERVTWRQDFQGNRATDDLPVLHVSWNDAQAYVRWLSDETGATYRLPTEAEWEHSIRANSNTRYWWGESRPKELVENLTGERDKSVTGRHWGTGFRSYGDEYWGPAPGAGFMANSNGLFDMAGNVSEWVQDCWHPNYVRAPADGSAWENPGCDRRVVRGGYWASAPEQSRSAARLSAEVDLRGPQVGIRVARDL